MVISQIHAVLTADIVNSTRLTSDKESWLLATLGNIFEGSPFEFFRGDSFQAYLKDPSHALRKALLCRTTAISLTDDEREIPFDVRVSIGIGTVTGLIKKLGSAKGDAFLLSGRTFDEIQKSGPRLAIISENQLANSAFSILAIYLNSIVDGLTGKQAEIITGLLKGLTQQEIASNLGKSKSTVHQLTVSGKWSEIEILLNEFEDIIKLLS